MGGNGEDSSIRITRMEMEDNIFERPSTSTDKHRKSMHTLSRSVQSFIVENDSKLSHYSVPVVFGSVLVQVVLGVLANSLSLVADGARQIADHIERHRFDRTAIPIRRITEVLLIGGASILLTIICMIFLIIASSRTANVQINSTYLLIGAIIATTTNCLQLLLHVKEWRARRTYSMIAYLREHRSQAMHGMVYHSFAVTVLIVATLIFINSDYQIADNLGAYVIVALTLTNIIAIGYRVYQEYIGLEHARDEYEPL